MTLEITNETEQLQAFDFDGLFSKVVQAAADYIGCPYEISVNILLTDDERIHEINRSERNIDSPTDVLSFPMLEYDTAGDFSIVDENDLFNFDPDTGELLLGDIVISLDTAVRQAEEYNHSFVREAAFLCTHSMLHLFGYDHEEEKDRVNMEKMQNEILEGINITRDYE